MKNEYLLQLKNTPNTNIRFDIRIQNALKLCFFNVDSKTFTITEEKKSLPVSYFFVEHSTTIDDTKLFIIYLTFEIDTSKKAQNAQLLDLADLCFMNSVNKGESKFQIIRLYDERSIFYCVKAYPLFCEFESRLRCLILKLLTKTFGCMWAQKTIQVELISTLKASMKNSSIEKIASDAIYEMDYHTLQDYLFGKTRSNSSDEVVDSLLTIEGIQKLGYEGILEKLRSAKLQSNWERYFSDIHIDHLEEKLENIRTQRNKIAHSKLYRRSDYDSDKATIAYFLTQLNKAIEIVEVKPITQKDALYSIGNWLVSGFNNWSKFSSSFQSSMETVETFYVNLSKTIENIAVGADRFSQYIASNSEKINDLMMLLYSAYELGKEPLQQVPNMNETIEDNTSEIKEIETGSEDVKEENTDNNQAGIANDYIEPTPRTVDPTPTQPDV